MRSFLTCITNFEGEAGDQKVRLVFKMRLNNISFEVHVRHGVVEVLCWGLTDHTQEVLDMQSSPDR